MSKSVITDEIVEKARKTWSDHINETRERGLSHFHIGMAQKAVLEAVAPMILEEAAKAANVVQQDDADKGLSDYADGFSAGIKTAVSNIRSFKEPRP